MVLWGASNLEYARYATPARSATPAIVPPAMPPFVSAERRTLETGADVGEGAHEAVLSAFSERK